YWLRKGSDQSTLAHLFSKTTTQRQISRYLEQIRIVINNEFVPFFLGTKDKERDFFIKHNTFTSKDLLDLSENDLLVVADGTYCRKEKSANNQFQYDCYSEQKKDSLFKLYILTWADGYIIDCFGSFAANQNDSSIFKRILSSDLNLMKIMEPEKTLVLVDRGFRDIYYHMINDLGLKIGISTCSQLKEKNSEKSKHKYKKLTSQECAESRLVTKLVNLKGYICSCKSGKRLVGCCTHVATIIYFLSNSKFRPEKYQPAEYLNYILVSFDTLNPTNQPQYVRNRRRKKSTADQIPNLSSYSDQSESESEKKYSNYE
ncbi:unnamed protein product, partial [Brachionus calyciflorus]